MKKSLICLKSILEKKAIAKRAKNLCIWYVVRSKMEIWHFGTHFVAKLLLIDYFLQRINTFFSSPNKKKRKQRNFLFHRAHHRLIVASSHRRKRDFTLELAKGDEPGASERAHTRTTHLYTCWHLKPSSENCAICSSLERGQSQVKNTAEARGNSPSIGWRVYGNSPPPKLRQICSAAAQTQCGTWHAQRSWPNRPALAFSDRKNKIISIFFHVTSPFPVMRL